MRKIVPSNLHVYGISKTAVNSMENVKYLPDTAQIEDLTVNPIGEVKCENCFEFFGQGVRETRLSKLVDSQ